MFGEVMSLRRPSASAPSDTNAHPTFPLYLLPSLRIPFRRHRIYEPPALPSSATTSTSEHSSPLSSSSSTTTPSLSSSPTSPASPASPLIPSAMFPTRRLSRAHPPTLRCSSCSTDLAFVSQIISKGFTGRHGRAYLVSPPPPSSPSPPSSPKDTTPPSKGTGDLGNLVNIRVGRPETRRLVTGQHVVADIHCTGCGALVGWKYIDAKEAGQQYKVGMFILETRRVVGFHCWEDLDVPLTEEEEMDGGGDGHGFGHMHGEDKGVEKGDRGEDDGVVVFDSEDEDECEDMFAGVWDAKVVARRRRSRRAEEF